MFDADLLVSLGAAVVSVLGFVSVLKRGHEAHEKHWRERDEFNREEALDRLVERYG